MIGGEKMTNVHWALHERLQGLFAAVKYVDVQSMDDIAEEFGAFRAPDTHPHAPEEFKHAHILSMEVPSDYASPGDHEVPLRFTVVRHGALGGQGGFTRILLPGTTEWTSFPNLTTDHLEMLDAALTPWLESYPHVEDEIRGREYKERGDNAVAQLIEALHSRQEFDLAEVELLETLAQVFYLKGVPGLTPQATGYAKTMRNSALEIAKLTLNRLT